MARPRGPLRGRCLIAGRAPSRTRDAPVGARWLGLAIVALLLAGTSAAAATDPDEALLRPTRALTGSTAAIGDASAAADPAPATEVEEAVRVSAGPRSSGAVALTFDDGYSRSACATIARTLRSSGVSGTFFINGIHVAAAPARWRAILRGQQLGNHTRSHRRLTVESDSVVRRQIAENESLQERILGRPMLKVLRPPYGAHDGRVRRIAGELGYVYTVLWSVDSRDWQRSATVRSIIDRATGAPPGSIILMHCGPRETPRALPAIIRHYRSRGIAVAGLDVVLGLRTSGPDRGRPGAP